MEQFKSLLKKEINIKIFIIVICVFLIGTSLFALWNNDDYRTNLILNTIVIGACINVISAVGLVYLLDERDKKKSIKELNNKKTIIYNKMIPVIREFNRFVANMYKATMLKEIEEDSPITNNLYYDIDSLYKQVCQIDLNKPGYITDSIDFSTDFPPNYNTLSWGNCYIQEMKKMFDDIKNIYSIYALFLESDILERMESILEKENFLYMLRNPLNQISMNEVVVYQENGIRKEKEKFAFELTKLKEIFKIFSEIMHIINNHNGKNDFLIARYEFNSKITAPLIASGLPDNNE